MGFRGLGLGMGRPLRPCRGRGSGRRPPTCSCERSPNPHLGNGAGLQIKKQAPWALGWALGLPGLVLMYLAPNLCQFAIHLFTGCSVPCHTESYRSIGLSRFSTHARLRAEDIYIEVLRETGHYEKIGQACGGRFRLRSCNRSRRSSGMMSYDLMQYGTVGYDTCTMSLNCSECNAALHYVVFAALCYRHLSAT